MFYTESSLQTDTFLSIILKLYILPCHSLDLIIDQLRNNGTALDKASGPKVRLICLGRNEMFLLP